jgi:two-component system, cell cycle sensor histidine kinase and response regulator CckA
MTTERLQVLVVEDDEDDFFHLRQLLRTTVGDADVERAATAGAALEMASDHRHDLCFVDYWLGDKDGLEVLRGLRQREVAAPIIFLTGQGDEEVAVQAMKAGATDYLLKSKLTAPTLEAAVRYALTLRRKEEAVRVARRALRASEQRFRALVENSSDAIVLLDAQATIVYASQSVRRMRGYAPEEVVETNAFDYLHPEEQAGLRATFQEMLQAPGTPFILQYRGLHKSGEWRFLEATATNRLPEDAVGAVVINERDVTERKRAEEALRESEERYRLLFERNLAGVYRVSLEGKFVQANDSLARMLGCQSQTELLGRDTAEFFQNRDAMVEELRARGQVISFEVNARRSDGSVAYFLINSTLLQDKEGRVVGRQGTVLDITERRALEQQLLHAQKMEAVGQLAGGVAHDFNNLLMVISSYAELLSESICATNDKAKQQADEILDAARRAAGLTQQLLAFSRKQVMSPRILDLNTVLRDIGRMLPRLIGEDIQVVVRPGAELWKVKADPAQIEQVIMNLAVNARDAMPRGGQLVLETSNVQLDEEYARRHVGVAPGEHVMLTVSDTGCGIAPDILPHIFEPFFTTKDQGKGTGLGLPTVYGIVKQSGGWVWVYSEVGHGAVFKVYLPRAEATAEHGYGNEGAGPPPRGSETILVVEDEEAVRESTCEYLLGRGYTVLPGKNGADALQMLEHFRGRLDLLVTDVVMPGMSGAELGKRLRGLRPEARVLYISGYTESMVVQHGIEAATGFLQKPFTLKALAHKVREVLDAPVAHEVVSAEL